MENNNNNNFQSDYSCVRPEKPFTDKTNPNVQLPQDFGQQSAEQFEQIPDDQFFEQSSKSAQQNVINIPACEMPPEERAREREYMNQFTDFSQPVYQGSPVPQDIKQAYDYYNQDDKSEQRPQNNYQRYQAPPVPPYGHTAQPYSPPPVPPQPNQQYAYPRYSMPNPPMPPKKSNAGLIAVICVLSVLLLVSFTGICVLLASKDVEQTQNNKDYTSPNYDYTVPDFGDSDPQTTTPPVHDDSDFSDEIDKDFKGLELESKPKDKTTTGKYTSETAFEQVSDAVVGVVCYSNEITTVENCDSQGSGIIITSDGYVVTNAHVIGNSKTAYIIQIITADGKAYDAGVVGFDSRTDIAVLKIDGAKNLRAATFGDSEEIELGEDIVVVGNPGGLDYQNSITKGIVSAVDRKLSSTSLVKYIQTDAAINPGNSGGPIVNLYGQVIGIATSKIVSEHYEGMGFAIPSVTVKDIVDDLVGKGYVDGRVKIGISGNDLSSVADSYGLPEGILIAEITEGGPCDGTALRIEDIIVEADGETVTCFADMYEILEGHKEGDKITLKYYRAADNSYGEVEVTLQADK